MARSTDLDPFHCFRFAPRVGFEGKPMGVSRVSVTPGTPWQGCGEVEVEAALKPDMIEFAKINDPFPLIVGVYHITDKLGVDGDPSALFVLNNVTPSQGKLKLSELDASVSDVFLVSIRMKYDRLTFIFGHPSEMNVLDKIVAVV